MNWDYDEPVPYIDTIQRWPHQLYAVTETTRLIEEGVKRIAVTTPTGGGKSLSMFDLARWAINHRHWGVALFANRKILIDQMARSLREYGIDFGIRSADHMPSFNEPFQVCSVQTEYSRVVKRQTRDVHDCRLIIVDECHINENPMSRSVYDKYLEGGAVKVGFTATPLGLDGCYDELVVAGTNSELRECGALVPAIHYGCTEPDLRNIRSIKVGEEVTEDDDRKAIMVPGIHGRVIEHYRRLNPHGLPAIGFAPGVPESVGFAEAFCRAGIPSAHIDGDRIWIEGDEYPSTEEKRRELFALSRTGQIRCLWNRFVLREAVDMPWLRHGILATVFGTLQSYLQSGGRLLRACPPVGKRDVIVQDHGGNWWRHGSLNSDRNWHLGDTNKLLAQLRQDAFTGDGNDGEPEEPEPMLCPSCYGVINLPRVMRTTNARCPHCGFVFNFRHRSRPVIQANGELVEYDGNIFQPRRTERRPDTHTLWERVYWRAYHSKTMTFASAAGLFFKDNRYFPPRNMPLMPYTTAEWYMPVRKVPYQRLRPKDEGVDQ